MSCCMNDSYQRVTAGFALVSPGLVGPTLLLLRYCGAAAADRRMWRMRGTLVPQPWVRLEVAIRHTAVVVAAAGGCQRICW